MRKFVVEIMGFLIFAAQLGLLVAGSSVLSLLSVSDVLTESKRSHEFLFVLLEMYGLMHGLRTEVEETCQEKFCSGMWEAALSLTKSLAQAVQETLVDFEVDTDIGTGLGLVG